MINNRQTLSASVLAALMVSGGAGAADYEVTIVNLTRGQHFTPLLVAAHSSDARIFSAGQPASTELQAVAEGGNTAPLAALLTSVSATVVNGDALVAPGDSVTFTISNSDTTDNTRLSLVGMLLPTNDGFVGLDSITLPMGVIGTTHTYDALGYDAGTEANDEIVGSGTPGEPGFPAPAPVVATGTGIGGTGLGGTAEGFVHVHRSVLGDTDPMGGRSDISSTVHRWLNPVAHVTVTITGN